MRRSPQLMGTPLTFLSPRRERMGESRTGTAWTFRHSCYWRRIQKFMSGVKQNDESSEGVWTQLLAANWWLLFVWPRAARGISASQSVAQKVDTYNVLIPILILVLVVVWPKDARGTSVSQDVAQNVFFFTKAGSCCQQYHWRTVYELFLKFCLFRWDVCASTCWNCLRQG